MDPFAAYSGDADGLYERVVNHVVVNGGLVPRTLGPDALAGVLPGGRDALVIRWTDSLPDLHRLLGDASARGIEVALVGGPPEALETLKAAVPLTSTGGVWAWHVPESGDPVHVAGNGGVLGHFLSPPHGPPHWRTFQHAARTSAVASHAELTTFQQIVAGRRTPATWTLLVAIGLMYALEMARHAPEVGPAMLALGALNRDRVLDGEVWRLVSSTFLHGNLMHLAFNGFVLYSLGTTLERLLGTPRFVVLYTASALGGSLLSLVFLKGMSVGASGALWGLMTATFLLAVRDDGFLPEQVRAGLKRGAGQNLILNILVSFQPGVDWAAHAGGGLTGAALVLIGVITLGLPSWTAGKGRSADAVPAFVRGGAIASGLVLAAGLGVGLVAGGFGALNADAEVRRLPAGPRHTAELPANLDPRSDVAEGGVGFGDLNTDGAVVFVIVIPLGEAPSDPEAALAGLEKAVADPPEGFTGDGPPRRTQVDGKTLIEARYASAGLVYQRSGTVDGDEGLIVDSLYLAQMAASWEPVARQVLLSVQADSLGR